MRSSSGQNLPNVTSVWRIFDNQLARSDLLDGAAQVLSKSAIVIDEFHAVPARSDGVSPVRGRVLKHTGQFLLAKKARERSFRPPDVLVEMSQYLVGHKCDDYPVLAPVIETRSLPAFARCYPSQ